MGKIFYGVLLTLCLSFSFATTDNGEKIVDKVGDDSVDIYITLCLINFSEAMRTGVPVLGMPILDPFNISYIEIDDLNQRHLKLTANASDISVQKISYYVPTYVHVQFSDLTLFLTLTLDEIDCYGTYWCDGMYEFVFPVFGDGPFTLQVLKNTNDGLGAVFITPDGYLQISSLNMTIVFEELVVYFENFLGGGDFGDQVNAALSQLGKLYFDAMLPWIQSAVLPAMVNYINYGLMQHTLKEIIDGAIPKPPSYEEYMEQLK